MMAIYNIDIYDEGQSLGLGKRLGINFDGFKLSVPGYQAQKELRVKSVADMVIKVLAVTEGQKGKVDIYLNGKGGLNYQSVGAGANQDPSGDRSLQLDGNGELNAAAKAWLPRLIGRVRGIFLAGVDNENLSARNHGSFPLIMAVAELLTGVHVQDSFNGNSKIVYFPSGGGARIVSRTSEERQKLRESLKKLDRK